MSTGLDSFTGPAEIGPLYPFPGWEWVFVIASVVLWLLWHWKSYSDENSEYREAREHYKRLRLERVMFRGGTALIASEDELHEEHPPHPEEPPLAAR
jgi:hypothetical protein